MSAASHLLPPATLASLANLELIARTAVQGFLMGLHRSPQFGFSQEFREYRAYTEGDDPRFVDWNVYARTDRTYIRRYEGETNTRLMILLDASASMGYASRAGEVSKLLYAKYVAAALAYLASRQHDPVGLIVFDEKLRQVRPATSRSGNRSRPPRSAGCSASPSTTRRRRASSSHPRRRSACIAPPTMPPGCRACSARSARPASTGSIP